MIDFLIRYWIQVLCGLFLSLFSYVFRCIKKYKQDAEITKSALKIILKASITELYNDLIKKDCVSLYEKELILDLYNSYQSLGGGDFIKDLVETIDEISVRSFCKIKGAVMK